MECGRREARMNFDPVWHTYILIGKPVTIVDLVFVFAFVFAWQAGTIPVTLFMFRILIALTVQEVLFAL